VGCGWGALLQEFDIVQVNVGAGVLDEVVAPNDHTGCVSISDSCRFGYASSNLRLSTDIEADRW
jgi:hypothetical protein